MNVDSNSLSGTNSSKSIKKSLQKRRERKDKEDELPSIQAENSIFKQNKWIKKEIKKVINDNLRLLDDGLNDN